MVMVKRVAANPARWFSHDAMPAVSKRQRKFMAAVANNPKFAKQLGVPQSVGKEFNGADKRKGAKN